METFQFTFHLQKISANEVNFKLRSLLKIFYTQQKINNLSKVDENRILKLINNS